MSSVPLRGEIRSFIADIAGVSEATVRNWRRRGMPLGSYGEPTPETGKWIAERRGWGVRGLPDPDALPDLDESRIRLNLARERTLEQKRLVDEGRLVWADDAEQAWAAHVVTARGRLLDAAVRAAARGFGVASELELRDVIEDEVRLALAVLAGEGEDDAAGE